MCLHGGGSNQSVTALQVEGLNLSSRFDCVFLNAQHTSERHYNLDEEAFKGPFYAWTDVTGKHWDESLEYLAKFCEENGPFDAA